MTKFQNRSLLCVGLFLLTLSFLPSAFAATYFTRATGVNWNANGTWSTVGCGGATAGAAFPGSTNTADTATICPGNTITLTVAPTFTIASLTFNGGATSANLNVNSGITLTMTGAVTMNAPTAAVTSTFALGAGILSAASATINGGTGISVLSISTGSATFSGAVANAGTVNNGQLNMTGASTVNVGGNFSVTGTGLNSSGLGFGTINFNGAGAQTVGISTRYNNVIINKSAGTASTAGATTIGGTLTVTAGTLNHAVAALLTVTGATSVGGPVNGTFTHSLAGGTNTYTGQVTINANGVWTNAGNQTATFSGGLQQDNTTTAFTCGTGTQTFNATQTIRGAGAITCGGAVTISGAVTVTNTNTNAAGITITGLLNGTLAGSTWINGDGVLAAVLTYNNTTVPMGTGVFTANANPNTVIYSRAGAQTVKTPSAGYYNLMLGGTLAKTMPVMSVLNDFTMSGAATTAPTGALTVGRDFTLGSGTTFTAGALTHNVARDFINNGATFTANTSTINMNGGVAQAIKGTSSTTFNNLTIANTLGGVSLPSVDETVGAAGILTLTTGIVTTGAQNLIVANTAAGAVTGASSTEFVAGNLRRAFPVGAQARTFDVGLGTSWAPITVTFTNITGAGSLTVSSTATDHPDTTGGTSGIDANNSVNRYWSIANTTPITFTGSYGIVFNYITGTGDNDSSSIAANYVVAQGTTCTGSGGTRDCTAWTVPTAGGTGPSLTQASAVTMTTTTFGDFIVGQRAANNFLVTAGSTTVSTCSTTTVTVTARDSFNATITNYRGTVNLTTSVGRGNWSTAATGTFTDPTADDGAASYTFVAADNGSAIFTFADIHADSLTVTAADALISPAVSGATATINFTGNLFVIANDTIQVAGKPQSMTATLKQGGSCLNTLTTYPNGSHTFKAWYTADTDHPSGAIAPTLTGTALASPAITTSVPGANNLTLNFTSGVAPFTLDSTDVGKYTINLRDDNLTFANTNLDGTSPTITTRPFALVISAIKQGGTNNPSGTATGGSAFIAAGDTFQATVGAYLWSTAADNNVAGGDGVVDAGATLAQITANGAAPAYRWSTTLAAASTFTPTGGTLGTLTNGASPPPAVQVSACPTGAPNCFTGGIATPTNLRYPEVGSFTLTGTAGSFLNTSGADLAALVFDNSTPTPLRSGVVGRFYPDHFTLTASSITPACGSGGFTYMGDANLGYSFSIEARNISDVLTSNYGTNYTTGTVAWVAENADNGTDLSTRMSTIGGSWAAGVYAVTPGTKTTFTRLTSPDGPFDALQIGVKVNDGDSRVLNARDMNPATTGACVPATTCTAQSIGGATTKVRFGKLNISNAIGSGTRGVRVPLTLQYWSGTAFITNSSDSCTTLAANNISKPASGYTVGAPTFTAGVGSFLLTPTAIPGRTTINVCAELGAVAACAVPATAPSPDKAYLQSGASYAVNPTARIGFGVYGGNTNTIYIRENY